MDRDDPRFTESKILVDSPPKRENLLILNDEPKFT
jgi:hypothetical protein